ncbi:MAG: phenylacetate--CoA ligase [Solibacterales bacterium]|nr:phenylacetate--CoA ligase [Bryobacterales bacterium]|tara:strand:- start:70898 stop:72166 length:1269 start_codon:yes stop_codon:yes gene_type:complete
MPYIYGIHTSAQLDRLSSLLEEINGINPFQSTRLGNLTKAVDNESFVKLPLLTKRELMEDQINNPPFGSNLTYPLDYYSHYHQTSGTTGEPLRVLDTPTTWDWWGRCWLEVLQAAGVTKSDRIFFAFSFAPFIGFWSAYHAVSMLGAMAISGSGANSARRLEMIEATEATVLLSTPTYALHLAEIASQRGIDLTQSTITKTIHAGELGASIPMTRQKIEQAWGARALDHAGATEVGAFGIGDTKDCDLYVNEKEFIAEVIDSNSFMPIESGSTGELVITNLGRGAWPIIRYRTGDLVNPIRIPSGPMEGKLLLKGGILGRVDDMVTIRGVNIYPSTLENIIRSIIGLCEFRIIVSTFAEMDEIGIEIEGDQTTAQAVAQSISDEIGIRAKVRPIEKGTLPRWESKAQRFSDQRARRSNTKTP